MKIVHRNGLDVEIEPVKNGDIDVGTVFTGEVGAAPSVFLKTFSGIVDLRNPRNTWATCELVHNFKKVDATLVIND